MELCVPPLEDVPELLQRIELATDTQTPKSKPSDSKIQNSSSFGGFKKGFLVKNSNRLVNATQSCSAKPKSQFKSMAKPQLLPESSNSSPCPESVEGTVSPKSLKQATETSQPPSQETEDQPKLSCQKSKPSKLYSKSSKKVDKETPVSRQGQESLPHIKAQPGAPCLVIPEVQEALGRRDPSTAFQRAAQARLSSSSTVSDILEDPSWLAILGEFQKDPEAASLKYNNNAEVRSVMTQLCATLGDNFLNINAMKKKSEEESMMERLMEEPRVREALLSPCVQQIMDLAKAGRNDAVRRLIAEASDYDRRHIRTLLDFGLFSFAC